MFLSFKYISNMQGKAKKKGKKMYTKALGIKYNVKMHLWFYERENTWTCAQSPYNNLVKWVLLVQSEIAINEQ